MELECERFVESIVTQITSYSHKMDILFGLIIGAIVAVIIILHIQSTYCQSQQQQQTCCLHSRKTPLTAGPNELTKSQKTQPTTGSNYSRRSHMSESDQQLRKLALQNQPPILTLDDVEEVVQDPKPTINRKKSDPKINKGPSKKHKEPDSPPSYDYPEEQNTPSTTADATQNSETQQDDSNSQLNPLLAKKLPPRRKSEVLTKEHLIAMSTCKTIKISEEIHI